MKNATGATDEAFRRMSGALQLAGQNLQNAFQIALIGIGDRLLDESGGIVNALARIVLAVGDAAKSGGLKPLVDDLEAGFRRVQTRSEEHTLNSSHEFVSRMPSSA